MKFINLKKLIVLFLGGFGVFFISPLLATFTDTAAQASDDYTAKLIEGAKKEKELLFYTTTTTMDTERLLKGFNKKYPFIKTAYVRGNANTIINKIHLEARGKTYIWDVLKASGVKTMALAKAGFLAKHHSSHRKYYSEYEKDKEGYWTSIYSNYMVLAYNTKLVSPQEVPKSWDDVLDPKWKGKLGMPGSRDHWFAFMVHFWGKEKGLDFMKKLANQNLLWRQGATLTTTLVGAGEIPLGLNLYTYAIAELKNAGAPIDWVALEPVFLELHPIALSARSPHPNAARLFIDYALSEESQQMLSSFGRIPSRMGVDPINPKVKVVGKKVIAEDPVLVDAWEEYVDLYRKILVRR